MPCITVIRLLLFLSLCTSDSAAAITQFQTETSTGFVPLTTGFTPAPECSSITIVHSQRDVAVYQGCVGSDPSCCPQSGRLNNTYSPGVCPSGYISKDAHVGLDRLAIDTLEWEATCVPSAFTTCTRPWYKLPQQPMLPDTDCPRRYTSQLPRLTTPLTVSVFYYHPYDYNLDSGSPWPYRVGFRTTMVLSESWPILIPATTTPKAVVATHFIIRWKDSDFSSTLSPPVVSASISGSPPPGFTGVDPITTSTPSYSQSGVPENDGVTTTRSMSGCPTCATKSSSPLPSGKLSHGSIVGITIGSVVGTAGLVFGVLFCYFRNRKGSPNSEIELQDSGPNVGFLTLYRGETDPGPVADIVLVHGLRGHRSRTWTKDGCCWPKDLLPQKLPGIRVISFGYDSSIARFIGHSSRNNINQHATCLLADLIDIRSGNTQRPIIFVAHSLGGIVVKDALRKARELNEGGRYRSIYEATHSVIFLGTPHHGSAYARVGRSVADMLRWFWRDTNSSILRSLEYDSEILERISDDFRNTLAHRADRKIKICSFAEELSMSSLASPVVYARSAFIGLSEEITETIWAHHRDMCRFSNEDDPGYQRIARRIIEFVADATSGASYSSSVGTESDTSIERVEDSEAPDPEIR
ncbi:hypothetical protein B0O99DRAFT_50649 [Bisporella sp. PMI_857]|nr:hypothetical protein B0O99DRAFT_50649 [Bisporella sp. PMI_857]